MEFQKTINLLDTTSDNKNSQGFVTKTKVYDQSEKSYSVNKEVKIKTPFYCIKMEFQKIINLLDITSDDKDLLRFVTKKWVEVYDQSEKNYSINKEIRIKTPMLRSDLCDFSDAYIVVKGTITVTNPDDANYKKILHLKIMLHLLTAF